MADSGLYQMGQRDQDLYLSTMRLFQSMCFDRSTFEQQWEEAAALVLPSFRNTFVYNSASTPGEKKTDFQVDATGMLALQRFAAICDSLLTPRNMTWHALEADDRYVMKDRATQLYFQELTRVLFKERYRPIANFSGQNNQTFQLLGGLGNGFMHIDAIGGGRRGLRYKSVPVGQMYIMENHQGIFNGYIRWFRMNAQQTMDMVRAGLFDRFPEQLRPALESGSQTLFNFLHRVSARDLMDYDPERLDARGKPILSLYLSVEGQCILKEGGYVSFPTTCTRYSLAPDEKYGRGPAQMVLPALKTLNAEKRVFLKQGHRAADPVLLLPQDGIMDMNLRPGAKNVGGMSDDGKRLVDILPSGDIAISEEMMEEERAIIKDAFLVALFQILKENPRKTATEVVEEVNERGILLAPTVGQQQNEYLGPMIEREIDVLSMEGLLPPMPPRLREAQGSYNVVYTSPLSKAMRAQEAAGFYRTLEPVREIVNVTQNPEPLDVFNFEKAVKGVAEINGVPAEWMASDEEIAAKRQARAEAAKRQEEIQAGPAAAAMMKAETDRKAKMGEGMQ